ncbi:Sodium/glucose cotransporter 4 [Bulinus truncatus]|nr:Sodium/glucose cotransporter 4 [Bulinus truncatus]
MADIYAGAIFIQQAVQWDMYFSIVVLLVITAIYTVSGGLRAVIYTDTLQTVVMVIGSLVLMGISFYKVGGLMSLYAKYPHAIAAPSLNSTVHSNCGIPTTEAFHLLRDASSGDLPWPGNIFGITILSSWYFCNDQVLVQRTLAAKNMHHVKGGSILAAYLKVLPLFTTVFPGMISRVLFPDEVACTDPDICEKVCSNRAGCTNIAYPKLVIELLPTGLKGLMLASMMAALMSSLTSNFNSAATIFTIDIWKRFRVRATEAEMLVTGRIFILLLMGVSVLWIPVLQASQGGQLFNYIQTVTGYFAPPILAIFLLAVLWERTNEQGAFWGLMIGLLVGVIRMALDFGYGSPGCMEEDLRPWVISKVHFLHFTIILFVISLASTVIISLITSPIDSKHTVRLTWWTRHSNKAREDFPAEHVRKLQSEASQSDHTKKCTEGPVSVPKWRKFVYLLCGYEPPSNQSLSEEEINEQKKMLTCIRETGVWKHFVNINAMVLMAFGLFLWIFFA